MRTAKSFVAEEGERLLDHFFAVVDDGVAVGFLVAGVDQGVDGERVVFGGGDFFFEERSEDADFGGVEGFGHLVERRFHEALAFDGFAVVGGDVVEA